MRAIRKIVVHHSASHAVSKEQIEEWHIERGFSEIGYHYVIQAGGLVRLGRKLDRIGAHCKGHNSDSVGVCVVGSFEDGAPVPGSQWVALVSIVSDLMVQFGLSVKDVYGHKELGQTLCPGFNPQLLRDELADECEV